MPGSADWLSCSACLRITSLNARWLVRADAVNLAVRFGAAIYVNKEVGMATVWFVIVAWVARVKMLS